MMHQKKQAIFMGLAVLSVLHAVSVMAADKVVVVPLGGAVGNAIPGDVLQGKTFSSKAGKGLTGTLDAGITVETDPTVLTSVKDGVSWAELISIPAGFADGVDNGITSETDPTVPASVKDGVSWSELISIPAGFADGVDNDSGGDITGVIAGTGLSGGETSGDVTLSVAVPLHLRGHVTNSGVLYGINSAEGGGIRGAATNTGNVTNYGGYFTADGVSGQGVYGSASGVSGCGVYGSATNAGDVSSNYGGYFEASGTTGQGVRGNASGVYGSGVSGNASGSDGSGVSAFAYGTRGVGVYSNGKAYDYYAAGPGTNYAPFTGSHEVRLVADTGEIRPGMLVSVTGKAEVRTTEKGAVSLSSTLPTVTLTSKVKDKAVFGVLVSEGPLPQGHWYQITTGERFAVVNALGEGRMWVAETNGAVEAGDYITSSSVPGYGQRQDDDLAHSYTVGKAIETIDWSKVTETVNYQGQLVKVSLVAVVYISG